MYNDNQTRITTMEGTIMVPSSHGTPCRSGPFVRTFIAGSGPCSTTSSSSSSSGSSYSKTPSNSIPGMWNLDIVLSSNRVHQKSLFGSIT